MKKAITLIIALNVFPSTFCQTSKSKETKLKEQIITLEKAGWDAWKNKNAGWFQNNTTEGCLWVSSEGISDKTQMIKSTQTECNVKSVSIDSFKFVMLNENTVLLTYIAFQNGSCGNKKLAEKIRVSVNYIKQKRNWLEAFYMETPITE